MTKLALITGGGTGIGLACVKKFLEKGWSILAHFNTSQEYLKKLKKEYRNGQLMTLQADFTKISQINRFLRYLRNKDFDVIINNAGIHDLSFHKKNRIKTIQDILLVNTIVPTLIAQCVLRKMKQRTSGAIINVSSIGVKYGSKFENIFYSISKGGLEVATRTLAREGAPYNILVNAVRPGITNTAFHQHSKKNIQRRIDMIPLRRWAQPEEIAGLVYFLCDGNTFITNEVITIAGGE